jgi:hypothetical protein
MSSLQSNVCIDCVLNVFGPFCSCYVCAMSNLEILTSEDDKALIFGRKDQGSRLSGSAYGIWGSAGLESRPAR